MAILIVASHTGIVLEAADETLCIYSGRKPEGSAIELALYGRAFKRAVRGLTGVLYVE